MGFGLERGELMGGKPVFFLKAVDFGGYPLGARGVFFRSGEESCVTLWQFVSLLPTLIMMLIAH
jgi:hypothetical protein